MKHHGKVILTAAVLVPALPALAEEPDVQAELAELRARVAELEAHAPANWLTEQRAEEIRGLVQDVLADADTRSSLLQDGMTAGWDNGFFIAAPDNSFKLNLKGQIQYRFIWSNQDDAPVDNDRWGFENTRIRLGFMGHVIDPTWTFKIWGGWTSNGSTLLLDSWIMKDLGNGWKVQAGQFKLPTWREWSVPETNLQFVERSLLDARYSQLYSQGIQAHYSADQFRVHLALSDGLRTWNTAWNTPPSSTAGPVPYQLSNEYALSARGEWLISGSWDNYVHNTSWQATDPTYVLGGSLHVQQGEFGTSDDEMEVVQWTIDGDFKFGGSSVFAALIGTDVESSTVDRTEYGFLLQGGYFFTEDWELIGRYEWGDLDGAGTVSDKLSIFTIGVNRFWNKHGLKWTTDLGYSFKPVDEAWGGESRGWRADSDDKDGQIVFRSQIQLLY